MTWSKEYYGVVHLEVPRGHGWQYTVSIYPTSAVASVIRYNDDTLSREKFFPSEESAKRWLEKQYRERV